MKYILSILVIATCIFMLIPAHKTFAKVNSTQNGVTVMELFTSQGCSSCPSADALLGKYVQQNDSHVICLSFNVDYWNRLGWRDVYSDHRFSERQYGYARALHSDVYTPQLVINGAYQFVGSDQGNISRTLAKESAMVPSAEIEAQQTLQGGNSFSVDYTLSGNYDGCSLLAALVQNKTTTAIGSGENGGVLLNEYNVVRTFQTITSLSAKGNVHLKMPAGIAAKDCSIVLYLQKVDQSTIPGAVILHA